MYTAKKEAISRIEGRTIGKLKHLLGISFQEKWKNGIPSRPLPGAAVGCRLRGANSWEDLGKDGINKVLSLAPNPYDKGGGEGEEGGEQEERGEEEEEEEGGGGGGEGG
ncbi:hypothetical protein B7P43_G10347 [Cryptotermes secundus]|uniref:Uncharacterized protein n=1 Tax=Cryptotermes secundus TaxID=105785 RepID=A0A2J7PZG6_9NEOP|nr:hypothetical protein B7P43_G10347 [Cryptotermes secundus]